MKLAVPLAVATVSPLQCTTLQEGPMQGPRGAAPITSVAPHPCSQRPYGISCAAVLETEGHLHWLTFHGAVEVHVQKDYRQDMIPEPRLMALNTGKKILVRSVGEKIQLGR